MNSNVIVPDNFDDEPVCSYCCNELNTENELLNEVCFTCQDNEQNQAKLNAFDDLATASRHVLHLSEIVADDIRSDYRVAWYKATNSLCKMLRAAHRI